MRTLNDPVEYDNGPHADWTPTRGLVRGVIWGSVAALVITVLSAPIAIFAPHVLIIWLPRTAIAFAVAWILFGVVQRAAGMVGVPITAMVIGLTLLVLASHHFMFAVYGVPTTRGLSTGWEWVGPVTLLFVNIGPLVGIAACTALRHSGGADSSVLADILMRCPYWGWWR